jgi:hypothetical protein
MDPINHKRPCRPSKSLSVNSGKVASCEAIIVVSASGSFVKKNNVSCR